MFVSVYALSKHLVYVFLSLVKSYQILILTVLSTLITVCTVAGVSPFTLTLLASVLKFPECIVKKLLLSLNSHFK